MNKYILAGIVLIVLVTTVAFFPSLGNGFTNWDDDSYVTENPDIRHLDIKSVVKAFSSFYAGAYLPATIISYAVEYRFFGLDPRAYHLTNLILHVLNCLLVFWLLILLTKSVWASFFAALLFAVHPLRVESVAWVSERKDVLYSLFYLGSVISYLYRPGRNRGLFFLSILLALLSALAKSMAVTIPLSLILIDFLKRRRFDRSVWMEKIPYFAISAVCLVIAIFSQSAAGAMSEETSFNFFQNAVIAAHSLAFYLFKTVLPVKLSGVYPLPQALGQAVNGATLLSLAVVTGIAALLIIYGRRSRAVLFGCGFFIGTLLPVIQIVPAGQAIAERYTYMASFGIFYLVAVFLDRAAGHRDLTTVSPSGTHSCRRDRRFWSVACGAMIVVLSMLTWNRTRVWRDSITLWTNVLSHYPQIPVAYNNRGLAYHARGNHRPALSDFDEAIRLDPEYVLAYNNRGLARQALGDAAGAIEDYGKALQLDPRSARVHNNRGLALYGKAAYDSALADFDEAIRLEPTLAKAYNNRGLVYYMIGKWDQAIIDYDQALRADPDYLKVYNNRALAYHSKGAYDQAIADYDQLVARNPGDPILTIVFSNRGLAYYMKQDYGRAVVDFNRALSIDPKLGMAYNNRGLAYLRMGNLEKARRDAEIVQDLGQTPSPDLLKLLEKSPKR